MMAIYTDTNGGGGDTWNEDHENEDVISFCDLPMYNSSTTDKSSVDHHEDSFKEICDDSKSSNDQEDEESLFEFFSDEWNITNVNASNKVSSYPSNDNNIMFFGKIIPKNNSVIVSRSKKGGEKSSEKAVVPRVSVYRAAAPLKSKLLLVLFGLPPKIRTDKAEILTDIRNRQSRHAPTTFFPVNGGGDAVVPVRRSGEKGVWRFIRAVSCFGGQKYAKAIA